MLAELSKIYHYVVWTVSHRIEEAVRRQVVDAIGTHAADPANWPWCHDGFERVVAKAVLVFDGVVNHLLKSPRS